MTLHVVPEDSAPQVNEFDWKRDLRHIRPKINHSRWN